MTQCLVVVGDLTKGHQIDLRKCVGTVTGVYNNFTHEMYDDADKTADVFRKCRIWYCDERDAPILVGHLSEQWVGHEIKTFNMTKVSTRLAGEIVEKKVTPDGVIPA